MSNLSPAQNRVIRSTDFLLWFGFWPLLGAPGVRDYADPETAKISRRIGAGNHKDITAAALTMAEAVDSVDLLVPIPGRMGVSVPTLILAQEIALATGAQVADIIRRKLTTAPDHIELELKTRPPLTAGNVFLVDDVLATGRTMAAAPAYAKL